MCRWKSHVLRNGVILHASLYSGVFFATVTGKTAAEAVCSAPGCLHAHTLETTQHLFLECPCVAAAAAWLVQLWVAITGPAHPAPPCTAAVLLADDQRLWQPAGGEPLEQLWTALRLCWLSAVWAARCRRQGDPERFPVSAAGVVAATVAEIQQLIRRDFTRTGGDVRARTAAPSDWFRGPTVPALTKAEFLERWAGNGVLCRLATVAEGGGLVIRLSSTHPVGVMAAVPVA